MKIIAIKQDKKDEMVELPNGISVPLSLLNGIEMDSPLIEFVYNQHPELFIVEL